MHDASLTAPYLSNIDAGIFEKLALHFLRSRFPECRGMVATGVNAEGKFVAFPVDGLYRTGGTQPKWVFLAVTTYQTGRLRGKWLGNSIDDGDVVKAASYFAELSQDNNVENNHGSLFLVANRHIGEQAKLYRDVLARGEAEYLDVHVIDASVLLDYLDETADGQYAREAYLNIPANRLSLELLREVAARSIEAHIKRFGQIEMVNS